ncbi:hypothetical protein N431DRAFT_353777 [Stipitochalara longipes BDJ]|nr:hypothetical protein N431DRAFT_353777 [Stipitochalara longipes BDJ]
MSRVQLLCHALPKLAISSPSNTFTRFPQLSREIRNKVWKFAAMQPRDIRLGKLRHFHEEQDAEHEGDETKAPAILGATREARSEGLRFYTKVRESRRSVRKGENGIYFAVDLVMDEIVGRDIWVNFEVDRFVWSTGYFPVDPSGLPMSTMIRALGYSDFNFEKSVTQQIQHLTIDLRKCALGWHLRSLGLILSNEHMQKVTIVADWWIRRGMDSLIMKELHRHGIENRICKDVAVQLSKDSGWNKLKFGIELAPLELNPGPRVPMAQNGGVYFQYFLRSR